MEEAVGICGKTKRIVMELNIKLLYWQGMWYEDPEPDLEFYLLFYSEKWAIRMVESPRLRQLSRWLRNTWGWYMIVHGVYTAFLVTPVSIYTMWENKYQVVNNVYNIATAVVVDVGVLTILANKRRFRDMVDSLEEFLRKTVSEGPDQVELLQSTRRFCDSFTYYDHITIVPLTWTAVLIALFFQMLPTRTLYVPQWHPVDLTSSPYFEIVLAAHTLQIVTSIMAANTLVTTLMSGFTYISYCFKFIHNKFENIREISLKSLLSRPLGTEVQLQVSTEVERPYIGSPLTDVISTQANEDALNKWRAERRALRNSREESDARSQPTNQRPKRRVPTNQKPERRVQPRRSLAPKHPVVLGLSAGTSSTWHPVHPTIIRLPAGITKQALDEEMERQLKSVIDFHEGLLSHVKGYASLFDAAFGVLFLICTLLLAVTVLILKVGDAQTTAEKVAYLSLSFQVMVFFMVFNRLAGVISDVSAAVVEAVYFSDWLDASPWFKRSMLVIMTRSMIPIEVKPTGLDPFSLKNFAKVSKTAYQMIATLENM